MIDVLIKDFLSDWAIEKEELDRIMDENTAWNSEYRKRNNLSTKDQQYKDNKKSIKVSENETASKVLEKLPVEIRSRASLLNAEFKVEGSVGRGRISEIPWICVFDRDITESAQTGYYIVYLIRADLSGLYLSLNQGWTQYEKAFKPKSLAKIEIDKNARKLQKSLKIVSGFSFDPIDLKGTSDLAKGYELGNICSTYYDLGNLPTSESMVNDLNKLIATYRELKSLVDGDILDIDLVLDEEEFQERTQTGKVRVPKKGKVPKKKKVNGSTSSTWWRDPDMSFTAISSAEFKCENDPNHKTFISPVTSEQFMEAHHLIPMEFQDDFDASIDVPENIISLCPNCHRAFHNSESELKRKLVQKFLDLRKNLLLLRKIQIDVTKLLEYYLS